jgi:hypothetical protein
MAKPKVFISHISKETELAQVLKKQLTKDFLNFLDIFVSSDGTSIQAGGKWLDELNKALKEAQIEIILCSKESVGRPWVNFEAGAGWVRGIQVIPVCHSGMKPIDLPVPLSMLQAIEVNKPEGLQLLYEAIAKQIDMQAPAADFTAIADTVRNIEKKFRQAEQAIERIENPSVLCAASQQYAQPEFGFDMDVEVLKKAFPRKLIIERKVTARRLRELLTTERFDIIHLVLAVDGETGDLLFSPVNHIDKQPNTFKVDRMSAEGFANLVIEAQTRLIVLATCNALSLAVEVARITNIIGTSIEITGEAAAEWGECFYDLLAKGYPLNKAFDLTKANISVPMRLIRHKDTAFAPEFNLSE